MLARTNKGDLGAERRADLDENDLSSTSVDLFCEKHDYIFVKYLHEDKYENFKFKLRRGVRSYAQCGCNVLAKF